MASTHTTQNPGDSIREPAHGRGDEERLFITHANRLRRIVAARVNTSGANTEDACSFAWQQLLAKQPRRDTVFAWLATVAVHEVIRLDRRDRAVGPLDDDGEHLAGARGADLDAEARIVFCEIVEDLAGIHARKRGMLVMHAAGLTCAEIAAEHDIAPSRTRELIYQARLHLRQRLGLAGVHPRARK